MVTLTSGFPRWRSVSFLLYHKCITYQWLCTSLCRFQIPREQRISPTITNSVHTCVCLCMHACVYMCLPVMGRGKGCFVLRQQEEAGKKVPFRFAPCIIPQWQLIPWPSLLMNKALMWICLHLLYLTNSVSSRRIWISSVGKSLNSFQMTTIILCQMFLRVQRDPGPWWLHESFKQ